MFKLTTQVRFDFALLLCEVIRHGLPCQPFENWRYVDTMAVLQTTSHHGCAKLQCASHRIMAETGRAHRAPLGGCQGMSPAVSWRIVIPRRAVDPPGSRRLREPPPGNDRRGCWPRLAYADSFGALCTRAGPAVEPGTDNCSDGVSVMRTKKQWRARCRLPPVSPWIGADCFFLAAAL
jgi:hypothetical protein